MNVYQYAAITEKNWIANLEEMGNFRPKYTFYSDFSIAEFCECWMHDRGAVKDTYNRVIESWASSYEALTEIIMALNHKAWSFNDGVDSAWLNCGEKNRQALTELYTALYNKAVDEFFRRFKGNEDALSYYYEVTD